MQIDSHAYLHPDYLATFASQGTPRRLRNSGGWIIERRIPGSDRHDAMGPYPLFCCNDWRGLAADIDDLRGSGLVSVALVTDPLSGPIDGKPFAGFDIVRPFKTHYVADLTVPLDEAFSRHHRACARRASRKLECDMPPRPLDHLDEWVGLYAQLVRRYNITGMRRFSVEAFRGMLALPGTVLMRALHDGVIVGAQMMLIQGNVAHAHLAAFTETGYRLGASYLLDRVALDTFRGKVRFINWGGGSGLAEADTSGLAQYKQGWTTDRHTAHFLGAILDREAYTSLARGEQAASSYFPIYRTGEFGQDMAE
ncbi:GNAT family N-acetyltransferase [Rhodoferax sp.]|uniref:GNAT family N-acetyltransferase n=1 Tax=Rhodoferax sp. TaxID=50421 RepID=UPI002627E739|nr:GNAT family N-acetyltransferase [Rhodoferax sp.]MDD2919827.1 GNAT family N-acetyltransferase [Rhodoferax sp.]